MDKLPQTFIEKHYEDGYNSLIFGKPIHELTREELIAVIGHLSNELSAVGITR